MRLTPTFIQTLEVFPVVATTFGVCEIHRVRGEDGKVRECVRVCVRTSALGFGHTSVDCAPIEIKPLTLALPSTHTHAHRKSTGGCGSTRRTR